MYGPLHGGANEAVIKMLIRLKTPANIPAFLEAVKDKKEKLFGFGHRVYKNFDPRAKLIQQLASDVRILTVPYRGIPPEVSHDPLGCIDHMHREACKLQLCTAEDVWQCHVYNFILTSI